MYTGNVIVKAELNHSASARTKLYPTTKSCVVPRNCCKKMASQKQAPTN